MNQADQPTQLTKEEKPASPPCLLGHELGKCNLQQAGCGSLFEVLKFLYPPWPILVEMRDRRYTDPEIDAWLKRLEVISQPHSVPKHRRRRYW